MLSVIFQPWKFGTGWVIGMIAAAVILAAVFMPRPSGPGAAPRAPEAAPDSGDVSQNPPVAPEPVPSSPPPALPAPVAAAVPPTRPTTPAQVTSADLITATSPLERLEQARQIFRVLAAGNRTNALAAAKRLADPNERETALLTLVTEWTGGQLGAPQERARAIARLGLEAGLGLELTGHPELAVLWANEMTEGAARNALLQQTAIAALGSDPATAFAISSQVPENIRTRFYGELYSAWAVQDTEAALDWANQIVDAGERNAALESIRSMAPVGIGAAVRMDGGWPVVSELFPGMPAELSGQIRPGDRIVALAQGDNVFLPAQGLPLNEVVQRIRGVPGTVLQLQILPADAPPNALPRTVSVVRDQIKFKQ